MGIFYDHLENFVFIWYIFSGFGIMHQEKYGNPAPGVTDTPFSTLSQSYLTLQTMTQNIHHRNI
jgi:hypothetical protein